jgi:hypothetical protein
MKFKLKTGTEITREEIFEGLWETVKAAEREERRKDPCFTRWPDLDAMIEHIEEHGLPPKDAPVEIDPRYPKALASLDSATRELLEGRLHSALLRTGEKISSLTRQEIHNFMFPETQ